VCVCVCVERERIERWHDLRKLLQPSRRERKRMARWCARVAPIDLANALREAGAEYTFARPGRVAGTAGSRKRKAATFASGGTVLAYPFYR